MLRAENLVKKYMSKTAVDCLSVDFEPGHIYGLLGPNGSGKSTLMKMISRLIVPTSGEVVLDGVKTDWKTKEAIAYMPTEPFFYNYMKVKDVCRFYSDFYSDFDAEMFKTLVDRMELEMNQKCRNLSSGLMARLKLAATLSRHAKYYLLDEPFNGIDLLTREEIAKTVLEYLDGSSCMIISSHLVEELETIVDRVVFLKDGALVLAEDVESMRENRGKSVVEMYREIYG